MFGSSYTTNKQDFFFFNLLFTDRNKMKDVITETSAMTTHLSCEKQQFRNVNHLNGKES